MGPPNLEFPTSDAISKPQVWQAKLETATDSYSTGVKLSTLF